MYIKKKKYKKIIEHKLFFVMKKIALWIRFMSCNDAEMMTLKKLARVNCTKTVRGEELMIDMESEMINEHYKNFTRMTFTNFENLLTLIN